VRFGLTILPEERWAQAAPRWRAAEDLGWDDLWTYDHLVWGGLPESPWFGAVPTLTAAASVTSRVGLGTFVASPNFRHPVPFVRDALALDDISGGRLLLGVGTGGDLDAAKLGDSLPLKTRVDRFHEWARLLRRLLDEDHVDHDGEHFRAVDARTLPGPVAAQGIPLLIAANGPRSIRLAAEVGDGWVTYGGAGETLEEWWDHVAGLVARLDDALGATGRTENAFRRILSVDSSPVFGLSSAGVFEEMVARADALGFTDVVTHWPRPEGPYAGDVAVLERVSADCLPRWRD
jgi:alkanesulfonate monooxygenase SsuD/methylene tetrahydromethanopterin reductase-like flavin-dependent oxidoreductase (luciferase family)